MIILPSGYFTVGLVKSSLITQTAGRESRLPRNCTYTRINQYLFHAISNIFREAELLSKIFVRCELTTNFISTAALCFTIDYFIGWLEHIFIGSRDAYKKLAGIFSRSRESPEWKIQNSEFETPRDFSRGVQKTVTQGEKNVSGEKMKGTVKAKTRRLFRTLDRTSVVFAVTPPIHPRFFFKLKHPTGVESSLGVRVLHLVAFHPLPPRGRSYVQRHVCACRRARVYVPCVRANVRRHKRGLYRHMRPSRDCRVGGKADIAGGVSKPFRRPCREFSTAWFSVAVGRPVHPSPRVRLIVHERERVANRVVAVTSSKINRREVPFFTETRRVAVRQRSSEFVTVRDDRESATPFPKFK